MVRRAVLALLAAMVLDPSLALGDETKKDGDVHVDSYYRKDGTYVPDHYRSHPNDTKADNWSTKGNENPYTGKKGSEDPLKNPFETKGSKSKL